MYAALAATTSRHVRLVPLGYTILCPLYAIQIKLIQLTILTVFPLIYHDINAEIPEATRPVVLRLFQLWLVLAATLIINMVACIFILASGSSDGGKDLGASIGCVIKYMDVRARDSRICSYIFIIGPLSFLLWYR